MDALVFTEMLVTLLCHNPKQNGQSNLFIILQLEQINIGIKFSGNFSPSEFIFSAFCVFSQPSFENISRFMTNSLIAFCSSFFALQRRQEELIQRDGTSIPH